MIPAILSAVFVFYLYHSLRAEEAEAGEEAETHGDSGASAGVATSAKTGAGSSEAPSVSSRLEALQHRIDRLADLENGLAGKGDNQ